MKNKSLLRTSLIASIGLLAMSHANAANSDWYGNISLGNTQFPSGISNTTGTAKLDESGTGTKFTIGKKIDKTISIEGFYADFGSASLTGNNGDTFRYNNTTYTFIVNNAKLEVSGTGIGIDGKFDYAINEKSKIAGRIGLLSWKTTATASGSTISTSSSSSTGSDIFYGVGYQYDINKKFAVTVDYDFYKLDTDTVNFLAIGASMNF